MIDRNTKTKRYYVIANILWMLYCMLLYRWAFFYHVPGLFVEQSKLILWAITVGLTAFGVCITYKRRRNGVSIATNVLIPFEIYAIITYYYFFTKRILYVTIFAFVLAVTYSVYILLGKKNRFGKASARTRIRYSLLGSRTIVAVCLGGLLLSILFTVLTDDMFFTSETTAYEPNDTVSRWYEDDQVETIKLLKEDVWKGLNVQERVNALSVIVNIEAKSLAINHEIHLESGILTNNILAEYNPNEHAIVIDCGHIGSADSSQCLESACHEIYHAYQFQQVELYSIIPDEYKNMPMFDQIKIYTEEFGNYCSGDEDFEGYYKQEVEERARTHGKNCVEKYMYLTELYNRNDS